MIKDMNTEPDEEKDKGGTAYMLSPGCHSPHLHVFINPEAL